jgi:hypothetical protein
MVCAMSCNVARISFSVWSLMGRVLSEGRNVTGEIIPHFFLLPHRRPLAISCSMKGWSAVVVHAGGCCSTYRSRARMTAELPTVQPSASEASWLSCWRRWSSFRLSVKVRGKRGCFLGVDLGRAINRDHISPEYGMLWREQIVTRTHDARGVRAQCLLSLLGLNLSFSLIRDNFDAKV